MTFYVENETSVQFPFVVEDVVRLVCEAVLDEEGCPFETQINVILTDNEGIHFIAILAVPETSINYVVETIVDYDGKLKKRIKK